MSDPQMPRFDALFLVCVTLIILAVIAAIVLLDVTGNSTDVKQYAGYIVTAITGLSVMTTVQSARKGVGKTNQRLNGDLDDRIKTATKAAVEEHMAEREHNSRSTDQ